MKQSMKRIAGVASCQHQRGIAAVLAVIFLITAVIFVLMQTQTILGTTSIDNNQQRVSTAALFLAESGLERGQAVLAAAPTLSSSICTGIGGATNYSLGAGTFNLSATSVPATCDNAGSTFCTSCTILSTGTVGSASRTISRTISLTTKNGKGCNTLGGTVDCSNPILHLNNTLSNPAVAVLNLAYDRQGQSIFGACTGTGCALQWLVRAKQTSADMGNSVNVAAGLSYDVTTTLQSTNYSYVGALFPGASSTGPTILGSYWDQQTSGNGNTVGKNSSGSGGGYTNNGVATGASTSIAPVDANSTTQTSTKWCYGGDTLIFGFGGSGSSTGDLISNVAFNTAGTPAQNVPLTQVARYPVAGATDVPATHDIYSQIFYARNPNLSDKAAVSAGSFVTNEAYVIKTVGTTSFTSIGAASNTVNVAFVATGAGSGTGTATPLNPFALNASSYKGNGTGAIGAQVTGSIGASISSATIANNSTSFTVNSYTSGTLQDGDVLVTSGCTGLTAGNYVVSHSDATHFILNAPATNGTCANKAFTFKSTKLTVTAVTSGTLYPTDGISGGTIAVGTSISSWDTATGGTGTYNLSGAAQGPTGSVSPVTVNSTILHVTACTICDFENGDALQGLISGRTINGAQITTPVVAGEATGGIGRYPISGTATRVASSNALRAGTPGATIYLPATESIPTVNGTRVAVASGTGVFAANTTATAAVVANAATNKFTASPAPTTNLDVATICAGTCAFFDHVGSTNTFTFTATTSDYWSSSFMCLKGVDVTPPVQVSTTTVLPAAWTEVLH